MAGSINKNVNEYPLNSLLNPKSFVNLDTNIQNKIIDAKSKEQDGGKIGKILGLNPTNVSLHIALILCVSFVVIFIIDLLHSYFINSEPNMGLFDAIMPVITLALGYIFGKSGESKE